MLKSCGDVILHCATPAQHASFCAVSTDPNTNNQYVRWIIDGRSKKGRLKHTPYFCRLHAYLRSAYKCAWIILPNILRWTRLWSRQSSTADQPWMAHEAIRWDPSNAPTFTFNRRSFPMNFKIGHVERPLNIWKFSVRWGWVFLERTWIVSGIQFTTHFIEFFVMETKQFVHSTVNVISTLQTCAQRSNKAAESKHRALGTISLGEFAIFYKYQNVDETEI